MKKLIILFIAVSLYGSAQQNPSKVYIWRVLPDSICPGDTIRVNYKVSQFQPYSHNFYLQSPYQLLGTFSTAYLLSRPKEHWSALNAGDSCYLIKFVIPASQSVGAYTVFTESMMASNFTVAVKNCSCTMTAGYTYSNTGLNYTFTSNSTGTTSTTQYWWDFDIGAGYQQATAAVNFTYSNPGIYNVKLHTVNATCDDVFTDVIMITTVGIPSYELNKPKPSYRDIYGNAVEFSPNTVLFETIGDKTKLVIKTQ